MFVKVDMNELAYKNREYISYIEEHYTNVQKAFSEMQEKCKDMQFIYDDWRYWSLRHFIETHDQSKYSPEEFVAYRRKFYPCANEEVNPDEFKKAIEHHYANNEHHWQFWINRDTSEMNCPDLRQTLALVEMVCDWTAMGYKFGDTALDYFNKNKSTILVDDNSKDFIERICKKMR